MKVSGLLVATVVLAGLSGVLYWSSHHPPAEATTKAPDAPPKILALAEADISKIEIQKNGAEALGLAKNVSGKWQIAAPEALAADQDAISSMLSTLSTLNGERLVEDKASDLARYGLAKPALEIVVTAKDKTQKLLMGDDTPTGSAVFAKLEGDPRVFTVASYTKTSIDKSPNDVRDKRLLTADFDKVSQIEVLTKKQDLAFGRNKQEWQILKPKPMRADNFQVEDFVRKLREAKMEVAADTDTKKVTAAFGSGAAVATAKVTDSAGTQELQVRKNKDDFYAKSSAVVGVYKTSKDFAQALDKSVDDFRNKKLFDFAFDAPNKVELHDGAKAYSLTKAGEDWWSDGKKMETASVQSLIDKVRELSASKFVDSGFTSTALELTVASREGKRVERVLISKNGNHYIAKRENEPALYEVDSAAVGELQAAGGALKPTPEPTPAARKK